jgi:hypothetical protein
MIGRVVILLVTNRGDLTADWLVIELRRRGASFLRFNTEDFPTSVQFAWTDAGESVMGISGRQVDLRRISAVWWRRPLAPRVPSSDPALQNWLSREAQAALDAIWGAVSAVWVNDPARNRAAGRKPCQLRAAQSYGLHVPLTLVSNDPQRLAAFAASVGSRIVCKPLTHGEVDDRRGLVFWTRVLGVDDIAALSVAGPEPYLIQELIAKAYDIRVTVVGETIFAARIESPPDAPRFVDWRRSDIAALRHSVERLPDEIAAACIGLTRHFGLKFAAIDLARRSDGGHTFFEINPNGQWAWIEQRTGLSIAAGLVDLLEAA